MLDHVTNFRHIETSLIDGRGSDFGLFFFPHMEIRSESVFGGNMTTPLSAGKGIFGSDV